MKGRNELILNAATVLEAMQLWLDANFKEPLKADFFAEEKNTPSTISFRLRVIREDQPEVKPNG